MLAVEVYRSLVDVEVAAARTRKGANRIIVLSSAGAWRQGYPSSQRGCSLGQADNGRL
jgi:hypothetical protein